MLQLSDSLARTFRVTAKDRSKEGAPKSGQEQAVGSQGWEELSSS